MKINEAAIISQTTCIADFVSKQLMRPDDAPKRTAKELAADQQEGLFAVSAAFMLLNGLLVDINRLADAAEHLAYYTKPT